MDDEAFQIGQDAYIFGYPLVTMEITGRVMTNAASPGQSLLLAAGEFEEGEPGKDQEGCLLLRTNSF